VDDNGKDLPSYGLWVAVLCGAVLVAAFGYFVALHNSAIGMPDGGIGQDDRLVLLGLVMLFGGLLLTLISGLALTVTAVRRRREGRKGGLDE